ncbi:MAG: hypothetical protein VB046_08230 [Paludibacter sp.]|nr:hypothetical protein [Paludibacter sp.]
MSITTKIKIKEHLAEYCYGKFSGCDKNKPVKFPFRLDVYHLIWNLLERSPTTGPVIHGNLEIVLTRRDNQELGKDPRTFNYLGERSWKHIGAAIEDLFYMELYQMMKENKIRKGIPYNESIFLFKKTYAITSIEDDTLWKGFYRMKRSIIKREKRSYKMQKNNN